jgi:hypothetical protein
MRGEEFRLRPRAAGTRTPTGLSGTAGKITETGATAMSFIHMHANRLLRSEQRAQELVLYDACTSPRPRAH